MDDPEVCYAFMVFGCMITLLWPHEAQILSALLFVAPFIGCAYLAEVSQRLRVDDAMARERR